MSSLRAATAAILMLLVAACGNAAAAPLPAAPAGSSPPADSVQLVDRIAADAASAVPAVTGQSVTEARRTLAGLDVQVVSFRNRGGVVSAQWPPAGDPRPAGGEVVVWVGKPPQPPAAPEHPDPGPQIAAAGDVPAPLVGDAVSLERSTGAGAVAVDPAPASGVTPGLENMVPPPHPPRANIRTLPPAGAGTSLSGRASWYGPGFAGRGTACGTTFDPAQLTLASRELRCGTKVIVTGPRGSVEATVTDWGPAEWTNRRFDLSQATFAAVASLGSGVIDATVEVQ